MFKQQTTIGHILDGLDKKRNVLIQKCSKSLIYFMTITIKSNLRYLAQLYEDFINCSKNDGRKNDR